jgi:hypothetical protein
LEKKKYTTRKPKEHIFEVIRNIFTNRLHLVIKKTNFGLGVWDSSQQTQKLIE